MHALLLFLINHHQRFFQQSIKSLELNIKLHSKQQGH